MKKVFLNLIQIYQKYISLDHGYMGQVFPNTRLCRFTPSCSQYTYEAINRHGAIRGILYGTKRIFRCNPVLTKIPGTYDPVI